MQISMKCSVAVHCLIFIYEAKDKAKVTSTLLSQSTGCNPVIIRNILSSLKKAGIITVARGTGGAELCLSPSEITLFQIYSALEPNGLSGIIGIHPVMDLNALLLKNIQKVLYSPYYKIEDSIKNTMEGITLQSMIDDFHKLLNNKE